MWEDKEKKFRSQNLGSRKQLLPQEAHKGIVNLIEIEH